MKNYFSAACSRWELVLSSSTISASLPILWCWCCRVNTFPSADKARLVTHQEMHHVQVHLGFARQNQRHLSRICASHHRIRKCFHQIIDRLHISGYRFAKRMKRKQAIAVARTKANVNTRLVLLHHKTNKRQGCTSLACDVQRTLQQHILNSLISPNFPTPKSIKRLTTRIVHSDINKHLRWRCAYHFEKKDSHRQEVVT